MYRVHPSLLKQLPQINNIIKSLNISNIECTLPSSLPLVDIFHSIDYYVTSLSSSLYDALHFSIPVAITNPLGLLQFEKEIKTDIVKYVDNEEKYCLFLSNKYKQIENTYSDYADEKYAFNTISNILNN
jgi:hypothetical protein